MMDRDDNDRDIDELLGDPEPWEAWEARLVVVCLLIAFVGLVVLGWLINHFILN